ncbi:MULTISPECIES: DUF2238 domain-containing protein [unclassified Microbacterium]|uniref:DUF2238 domain-containing protein n=1 Tax=unclassified Microbacterium TaxID=2609290 RepID=UPI003862FE85
MIANFLRPPSAPLEWAADGIRVLGLLSVVIAFIWWEVTDAGILALALPTILVPRFLGARASFDIVYGAVVSIAAWSNVLGLYRAISWWDLAVHFAATGLIAAMLYLALRRAGVVPPGTAPRRVALVLVTTIGLAISAVWEMIEWLGKAFISPDIFVTYDDTVGDMVFGGLGALAAAVVVARTRIERTGSVESPAVGRKEDAWQSN